MKPADFSGKNVVITGTLAACSRPRAQSILIRCGARCTGAVSRKTDLLIVGDKPGHKLELAEEYGTPILYDEQFSPWLRSLKRSDFPA